MPTVGDVLHALETIAPSRFAFSFDRIGLQIGDAAATVETIVVSLDPSHAAVERAIQANAQMLVSHHPVVWDPLQSVRKDTYKGKVAHALIANDIAFAAAHTNWDCAPGGVNDTLAEKIGLTDIQPVGAVSDKSQTKIAVTAPRGSQDAIIDAMAAAGAGVIGLYERCAFSVPGTGTFRATQGASPTLGKVGKTENVEEVRIEMVCPESEIEDVVAALTKAHPYETPAYDVFPVKSLGGHPISRIGRLPRAMSPAEFRDHLDKTLETRTLLCAPEHRAIETVVVCGGAAADEWTTARGRADAFVSGEVPHHIMVEASETGLAIAASGHFATENPGALRLADRLQAALDIEAIKFSPQPGESGRPLA